MNPVSITEEKQPIVDECRDVLQAYISAWSEIRKEQERDMQYIALEQFTSDEIQSRQNDARPCYVVDRINPTLNVVVNEQRENLPAAAINPVGDGADTDTAQVIEGLVRAIEQQSSVQGALANAAYYQAAIGEGYFRLTSRYIDEASFDQELVFKPIDNPFSVLFDPASVEPDGKDADVVLVVKDMGPYEYKNKYPNSNLASAISSGALNNVPGLVSWGSLDMVRLVEYWKREYVPKTLYKIDTIDVKTGTVVGTEVTTEKPSDEETDTEYAAARLARADEVVTIKVIKQQRKTAELKVKMYLINGIEVLSETEWPGRYIPIFPVRGDFLYANEKRIVRGIVRPMRDAQKIYNLTMNAQIEAIALAPKSPFVTYAGATEGFEEQWETANTANHAVLYVNPKLSDGTPVPIPQRLNAEPAIQAIAATRAGAAEDLKVTSGVPNAAFGIEQSEESGKAILARQQQARTTNAHYAQNVARSYKHAIQVLVDIIPHYYSQERMVQIVKPDGKQEMVAIGTYANSDVLGDIGEKRHDLTVGKYDVVVETGKPYSTRRQEAVASMIELAKANPTNMELFEDLMVKEMDWPGAKLVSRRLKAALAMKFPGLLEATDESDDGIDESVKAALANKKAGEMEHGMRQAIEIAEQQKQQIELLHQEIKTLKLQNDVQLKKAELDYDIKVQELQQQEQLAIQKAMEMAAAHKLKKQQLSIEAARAANTVLNDAEDRGARDDDA